MLLVYIMMDAWNTRPCGPEESKRWTEFLDLNFGYQAPQSYAVDFAPLFEPLALERSRLVWRDGKIVSSATLYPVTAVTLRKQLRLAIIGAVATREEYRGLGLSSQVLHELEEFARQSGVDAVVLWSDQQEFYSKAGYRLVGQQHLYSLARLAPPAALSSGTAVYGWTWQQVRALYERHPMRIARTDAYWQALQGIKSCTRVQWLDESGRVLAYLGFDRGRDLNGIVHEWGGESNALYSLLWIVLQNRPNLLWLSHPRLPDPIRAYIPTEVSPITGSLGFFKPLSATVCAGDFDDVWFWGLDSL